MPSYAVSKEIFKLDLCDKKILTYLAEDYLMPRKRLASMLKISPQKLLYRIRRLKEVLIDPTMILDYPRLGIESHIVFIKGTMGEGVVEELLNHPSLYFFYQTAGTYSYILNLVDCDPNSFCNKYFPNNFIDIHKIIAYIPGTFNSFNLDMPPTRPQSANLPVKLSRKDYQILYHLGEDPHLNRAQLAAVSRIDRRTIDKRINYLLESGVVRKFRYSCNIYRFGFIIQIIKIKVPTGKKTAVLKAISMSNYNGFTYESYDIILHQHLVINHQDLNMFVKSIRQLGVEVEMLQKTGSYGVHCIPKNVTLKFKSLMH